VLLFILEKSVNLIGCSMYAQSKLTTSLYRPCNLSETWSSQSEAHY